MATLHGFIFAIDINDLNYTMLSSELKMMLSVGGSNVPLLILCCDSGNDTNAKKFDLNQFSVEMNLSQLAQNRPWAAFKINVTNMLGVETALAWILHHLQNAKSISSENLE